MHAAGLFRHLHFMLREMTAVNSGAGRFYPRQNMQRQT